MLSIAHDIFCLIINFVLYFSIDSKYFIWKIVKNLILHNFLYNFLSLYQARKLDIYFETEEKLMSKATLVST